MKIPFIKINTLFATTGRKNFKQILLKCLKAMNYVAVYKTVIFLYYIKTALQLRTWTKICCQTFVIGVSKEKLI